MNLFSNVNKWYLGYVNPVSIIFLILKIILFVGDLTNIPAEAKSLLFTRVV